MASHQQAYNQADHSSEFESATPVILRQLPKHGRKFRNLASTGQAVIF
jgi:hypothetical protein